MLEVIGSMKSKDTQKAIRYLKERRIPFQFVDIAKAELGEKVWRSIFSSVDSPDALVDRDSRYYKANGCAYMEYDARELLIEHPEAMVLPVLRNREKARAGWSEGFVEELA